MTTWKPGMRVTAARLNNDTPTTTTVGLTPATGFTVNTFAGYRAGNVITLDMYLARTGTDITAPSGNLAPDVAICTVPTGWQPTSGTINGTWDNGAVTGGFVIGTDGITTLRTASGTITGTAGTGVTNLRLHITFIVD